MATKLTYKEQLLHPNWQRKRLEMLEAAAWTCSMCGSKDDTLHVHHKQYFKGRMAWEYSSAELAVLCSACHTHEHNQDEIFKYVLSSTEYPISPTLIAMMLTCGYFNGAEALHPELESVAEMSKPHFYMGVLAHLCSMQSKAKLLELANLMEPVTDAHAGLISWLKEGK